MNCTSGLGEPTIHHKYSLIIPEYEIVMLTIDSNPKVMNQYEVSSVILKKDDILPQEIVGEWDELLRRVEDKLKFYSYEWINGWLKTIGSLGGWTGKSEFILVRKHDQYSDAAALVGIAVLVERKIKSVISVWSLAGYFQPWRTVIADVDCQKSVAEHIAEFIGRNRLKAIQLGPLNLGIEANVILIRSLEKKGFIAHKTLDEKLCVYDRDMNFEEYESRILGNKLKKNIRYYSSKLRKKGVLEIKHYSDEKPEVVQKLINELKTVEGKSWLGDNGLPRFMSSSAQKFWTHVLNYSCIPRKQFDAWVMYFNDEPISFCVTLVSGSACYVIANQYDQTYKEFSTGSILYMDMMSYQFERGITHWDFGDGGLNYKARWGAYEGSRKTINIAVTNRFVVYMVKSLLRFKNSRMLKSSRSKC